MQIKRGTQFVPVFVLCKNNLIVMATEKIIIDLQASKDALGFDEKYLIHIIEFRKATKLINEQIDFVKKKSKNECGQTSKNKDDYKENRDYVHETITILGTRGSGKTSFLLTLLEHYRKDETNKCEVQVLQMIDPTTIEEKGHIFLNVISRIKDLVDNKLGCGDCNPTTPEFLDKKAWRACIEKLAHGLPTMDGVGVGLTEDKWQDGEFIMDKGLMAVKAANDLRDNFIKFIDAALKILDKKCFMIAFDDIDIDFKKGWPLLETIRKYFNTPKIITLLSGDMKLFSKTIRKQQWNNFGKVLINNEAIAFDKMTEYNNLVTGIEGQYMQKIMKPEHRIHLNTLYEKINIYSESIKIYVNEEKDENIINNVYDSILSKFGINSSYQQEAYRSFLLNLPIRTQIQFLSEFLLILRKDEIKGSKGSVEVAKSKYLTFAESELKDINVTNAFLSDLYEKQIDVDLATSSPKYINVIILTLLIREKFLREGYQLQPTTTDTSLNSSLVGLSFLFSKHTAYNKYIIFDFFIKIGYTYNSYISIGYKDEDSDKKNEGKNKVQLSPSVEGLIMHSGIYQDKGLSDIAAKIIAYNFAVLKLSKSINKPSCGLIPINSLYSSGKREKTGQIDVVFEKKGTKQILGYLPLTILKYQTINQSETLYSIYKLFGAIGDLFRRFNDYSVNIIDEESALLEILRKGLIELSQIRDYIMPEFEKGVPDIILGNDEEIEASIGFGSEDPSIDKLLYNWFKSYPEKSISPHLLGKISTRLFFAIRNIEKKYNNQKLGALMHAQIIALFNAILIEEVKENLPEITNFNINNTIFSDDIFISNIANIIKILKLKKEAFNNVKVENITQEEKIKKIKLEYEIDKIKNGLTFSKWMFSCPLFLIFINPSPPSMPPPSIVASSPTPPDSVSSSLQSEKLKIFISLEGINILVDSIDILNIRNLSIYSLLNDVTLKQSISKPEIDLFLELAKKHEYKWFTGQPREGFNKLIKEKAEGLFGDGKVFSRKILAFHKYLIKHPDIKW